MIDHLNNYQKGFCGDFNICIVEIMSQLKRTVLGSSPRVNINKSEMQVHPANQSQVGRNVYQTGYVSL